MDKMGKHSFNTHGMDSRQVMDEKSSSITHSNPADTLRNNDVVITSKWRHFDVITTLLLRDVFSIQGDHQK